MRVFVAVDLPEGDTKERVKAYLEGLGDKRWLKPVSPNNLHFTLAFIGEVGDQVAEKAKRALIQVKHQPFEVELSGIGFFPDERRPRVIWIGVSEDKGGRELEGLANLVRDKLREANVPYDPKPFTPHLTLARAKGDLTGNIPSAGSFGAFLVEGFSLKESVLTSSGPIYRDLQVVSLV